MTINPEIDGKIKIWISLWTYIVLYIKIDSLKGFVGKDKMFVIILYDNYLMVSNK
jgi:hypothetical protein